jgi:hypothetical protein
MFGVNEFIPNCPEELSPTANTLPDSIRENLIKIDPYMSEILYDTLRMLFAEFILEKLEVIT